MEISENIINFGFGDCKVTNFAFLGDKFDPSVEHFDVFFGVTNDYLRHAITTTASIIENNKNISFVYHFISSDDLLNYQYSIEEWIKDKKIKIIIHELKDTVLNNKEFDSKYSIAAFFRILCPYFSNNDYSLYVDSDVICINNIEDLFIKSSNSPLKAVRDCYSSAKSRIDFLGLKDNNYFNSGVLVFNNKPWLEKQLTKKIINFVLNDTREFDFPDQDAINGCLSNEIECLDDKYNYLVNSQEVNSNILNTDKIVFLHFAGDKKPWFPWYSQLPCSKLYIKATAYSPWKNSPYILETKNIVQLRAAYKFYAKNKMIIHFLKYYAKYRYYKMKL
ncbi:glycosyltransferase family 8 protein [Photorhabdus caribbeanensis]|uniref:glycosyltransferase family 8 protein n=1 Tax=Photorhabdus caribbeanensis TaxID=1004165 RepID=UPI001BD2580E|nr:glycosyltransferase [Photorhabdus caribbeanensis]MBS9423374.1 hypothetical protein [Photorhabdus caribbeanensis]